MKKGSVIITGINRGLGKELFKLFISRGYIVYGILRNTSEANALKNELPKTGKLILTDLSFDQSIIDIQKVAGEPTIDLLINTAGR